MAGTITVTTDRAWVDPIVMSIEAGAISITGQTVVATAIPAPTGLTLNVINTTRIDLSWNAVAGASGYVVYRFGLPIATPTGTGYSSTGLSPLTTYSYTVAAVVGGVEGPQSGSQSAQTPSASGELLLFDGFDYELGRLEPASTANPKIFAQGWTGVKREPLDGSISFYVHTVTAAEMQAYTGYSGALPGQGQRCLRIEALNMADGHEAYFVAGTAGAPNGTIPANVWFQFWFYQPYGPGEYSVHQKRWKLLYPKPQEEENWGACTWLVQMNELPHGPYWTGDQFGNGVPMPDGRIFPVCADMTEAGSPDYTLVGDDRDSKLGPTVPPVPNGSIPRNQWTLVKIHFDTSNSASGVYEVWLKPLGGAWTKAAEWIGGQNGLIWSGFPTWGHAALKFPSTMGWDPDGTTMYVYFDDFAMATSEAALPVY